METKTVSSFAKIDMSLDEIIKLDRKAKRANAAKKNKEQGKSLTPAQRRANTLKVKAKKTQLKTSQTSKPGRRSRTKTNAAVKAAITKKTKLGVTKSGIVSKGKPIQGNKTQTLQRSRGGATRQAAGRRGGAAKTQGTLGVRIRNTQQNQRNKRQQLVNQRRPGLQSSRVAGRKRLQSNMTKSNNARPINVQTAQTRRYNQQPRRQNGQQGRGRGRQQRGRRGAGRGSTTGRTVTMY